MIPLACLMIFPCEENEGIECPMLYIFLLSAA